MPNPTEEMIEAGADILLNEFGHTWSARQEYRDAATAAYLAMSRLDPERERLVSDLTRPIIGIQNRTAQETFDIMADRIRAALNSEVSHGRE